MFTLVGKVKGLAVTLMGKVVGKGGQGQRVGGQQEKQQRRQEPATGAQRVLVQDLVDWSRFSRASSHVQPQGGLGAGCWVLGGRAGCWGSGWEGGATGGREEEEEGGAVSSLRGRRLL